MGSKNAMNSFNPSAAAVIALLILLPTQLPASEPEEDEPVDMVIRTEPQATRQVYGEEVDRIFAPHINGWNVIDDQHIILWASRARPYLLTLVRPARGLKFNATIGLKRRNSNIEARFDSIYVNGFPYPIERIEKLDRETARRILGREPDEEDGGEDESE